MLTLRAPKPTEWAKIRRAFHDYIIELGTYGRRDDKYFDTYRTKRDHTIQVFEVDGQIAGFALLKWHPNTGTHLSEFTIFQEFRRDDIAFLAFQALCEQRPGRWHGQARIIGNISAFWKWSIRRTKGQLERREKINSEIFFAWRTRA